MKVLSDNSVSQKNYIQRMTDVYTEGNGLAARASESQIDGKTLDLILSLPTPRKEKELVRYLQMLARPMAQKQHP